MIDDENWRIVLGFPMISEVFSLFVVAYFYKNLSIIKLLKSEEPGDFEIGVEEVKKVYDIRGKMSYEEFAKRLSDDCQE